MGDVVSCINVTGQTVAAIGVSCARRAKTIWRIGIGGARIIGTTDDCADQNDKKRPCTRSLISHMNTSQTANGALLTETALNCQIIRH